MRFGSLFAGIGGIDLGLERAGMTCAWQVEIDDYCNKILEKHWPDVPRYKDVKDVGRNLEPVDLISGGFPCQPHSLAGKRRGAEDDRNLWPEYFRVIKELKPRYVLAENVPGILTTYIDTVLSDLESEAYTCGTFNVPAVAFGAPHRRERIFVIAYTKGSQGGRCFKRGMATDTISSVASYDFCKRIQREWAEEISRLEGFSRFKNVRRVEDFRERPDIPEPLIRGGSNGIPHRVDRLRALGNAVVPQVAEWIGRRIMDYDRLSVAS